MSILKKNNSLNKRTNTDRYKLLKYICNNCGAYNHIDQGFCGICKTSSLRKATKKEKLHTLSFYDKIIQSAN